MTEELWASRDELDVEPHICGGPQQILLWDTDPRELDDSEDASINIGIIPLSIWHANPSNPRIEPGECIQLDPSSFVVTARAKPEERWWLAWADNRVSPQLMKGTVAPEPPRFHDGVDLSHINSGDSYLDIFGVTLQPGECLDITHKVKAARAAGGAE